MYIPPNLCDERIVTSLDKACTKLLRHNSTSFRKVHQSSRNLIGNLDISVESQSFLHSTAVILLPTMSIELVTKLISDFENLPSTAMFVKSPHVMGFSEATNLD